MRKVAANYIFLPGFPLTRNGYAVVREDGSKEVVETGGVIREIAGLEFYGGLLVPDFVRMEASAFRDGEALLPLLEDCYCRQTCTDYRLAVIEGADLRRMVWKNTACVRLLG